MVSGDHNGTNAGPVTGFDSVNHLFARRVYHAAGPQKGKFIFDVLIVILGDSLHPFHGKPQYPQGLCGHIIAKLQNAFAVRFCHRPRPFRRQHLCTERQHFIHGAFSIGIERTILLMNSAHAFSIGIKGLFKDAGICVFMSQLVNAKRIGQINQRTLCRIA